MVSRPSDSGRGVLGLAAAGLASATEGVNSQFGLPSALISRTILGSTRVTSLTSMPPVSRAPQRKRHGDRLHLDHVGVLGPRHVEELDACHRDGGRGQQRQADRPVDHEVAAGRLLDLRDDLRLEGIDVDEAGCGEQRHDQQADDAAGADQQPLAQGRCHGTPPLPDAKTLAHRPPARHRHLGMSTPTKNMAEIVNLKRARKDKARRERENEAEANRRRFGRTKAEKAADKDAEARSPPHARRQGAGSRKALASFRRTGSRAAKGARQNLVSDNSRIFRNFRYPFSPLWRCPIAGTACTRRDSTFPPRFPAAERYKSNLSESQLSISEN